MRPAADSDQQKQQVDEAQMRVIPINKDARTYSDAPKPGGFWHRLAAAIDSLAAYPVKHALSEQQLCHVDDKIARLRQLMPARPRHLLVTVPRRMPARYAPAAVKVRP
jgi:hypothetical protein